MMDSCTDLRAERTLCSLETEEQMAGANLMKTEGLKFAIVLGDDDI
jgi:hypothetical protein